MTKAGRPSVFDTANGKWADNLEKALPRLVDANAANPIKTVGEFGDLAHDAADNLWKNEIQPQIDRHAETVIDTTPIRDQIRTGITSTMKKYFPDEAASMEQFANLFNGKTTVGEANNDLQAFNAKLKGYYRLSPEARAAIGKTDGDLSALQNAADGMREQLYTTLEANGEKIPRDLRKQYGALKSIESVFDKRATVADRQAPLGLGSVLSWLEAGGLVVGGVATGHPAVAAGAVIPLALAQVAKKLNSPEYLIQRGLRTAEGSGVIATAAKAAKNLVNRGAPAVVSQAGQLPATVGNQDETTPSENQ
jgi:hypothetical protein